MDCAFLPLLLLRDGEAFRTRLRERRVGAGGIAQLALSMENDSEQFPKAKASRIS